MDIDKTSNKVEMTETSSLLLTKHMKPNVAIPSKLALSNTETTTKYKGVVQQQNGHWGAQIYTDHKRIWLGTFKSAVEAATAYDSASIKLRSFDANSHRNFPLSDLTIHEPDFQECYTTEAVLNMIRDGSYTQKFRDFLRIRSHIVANINIVGSEQESNKCFSCTQLFQKELTPSDVGKLNRLVIPKKYAVKYLPLMRDDQEDVEIVFYDRGMRQWKLRYCYWRSSQSFVFTRGWNGFVKEKNLKEKDVIVFYTCNVPNNVKTLQGQNNNFLMIDVHYFSEEVNKKVPESSDEEIITGHGLSSKLEDEETKSDKKKKGGFMLFGVRIQ